MILHKSVWVETGNVFDCACLYVCVYLSVEAVTSELRELEIRIFLKIKSIKSVTTNSNQISEMTR